MPFGAVVAKAAKAAGKSKAFEHLGKIKANQWKEMGKAFGEMSDFAKKGGVASFIGGTIGTIKTKIENQVIGMFAPVINEITQFTADLLTEAEPLTTALGDFIGLLKSLNIQLGDVNISLLDVVLGFPLLIKALNGLVILFTPGTLASAEELVLVFENLVNVIQLIAPGAGPTATPTLGPIPVGPGSGREGGYQEY